jgi:hypothetical protein
VSQHINVTGTARNKIKCSLAVASPKMCRFSLDLDLLYRPFGYRHEAKSIPLQGVVPDSYPRRIALLKFKNLILSVMSPSYDQIHRIVSELGTDMGDLVASIRIKAIGTVKWKQDGREDCRSPLPMASPNDFSFPEWHAIFSDGCEHLPHEGLCHALAAMWSACSDLQIDSSERHKHCFMLSNKLFISGNHIAVSVHLDAFDHILEILGERDTQLGQYADCSAQRLARRQRSLHEPLPY